MKKIVIGIPTYNGSPTIIRTFNSLKKSIIYCKFHFPCEIKLVFLPNGCTDNTKEIINEIIKNNPEFPIEMIIFKEASKPAVINFLHNFDADYIGYVDDDVIFDEEAINKEVEILNGNDDVWAVFVDSFPLPCRENTNWWSKIVYNALTLRTRFGLLANRYDLLIGRCVLLKKNNFPFIPEDILNEDQFLDYVLYPHIERIKGAFVYYEGVYSIKNNFQRDIRITAGRLQVKNKLSKSITAPVDFNRSKAINYKKLFSLSFNKIILYIIYRIIYRMSKIMVAFYLFFNKKLQWKRTH